MDSGGVLATAGGTDIGRSESIQFFHGSEVAFWPHAEDHIASVLMTTSLEKGNYILLESTSNGKNNIFYELCSDAINNSNDFCFIFIPWFWHKEYCSYDINDWQPSKEWLEYQKIHKISLQQLRWAYLKNTILCKVSGENCDDGPSIYFQREFPANYKEAFLSKDINNTFISLEEITKNAISSIDLNDFNISVTPKITQFKQKKAIQKSQNIILGVDVARGGGDLSWIIDRQGDFLGFNLNEKINLTDTMQVAYWISKYIQDINPYKVFIDSGGLGISVVDRLKELGYQNIVVGVNFASKAISNRFLNKRAEIWYLLKEFFSKGGYIINDPLLLKQICSVKASYNLKGQLQIEDKKSIRSSLKMSPDGADAAALTFSNYNNVYDISLGNITTEFDPFSW